MAPVQNGSESQLVGIDAPRPITSGTGAVTPETRSSEIESVAELINIRGDDQDSDHRTAAAGAPIQ